MTRTARAMAALVSFLLCAACAKQTHDMDDQPKLQPQEPAAIFADGRASQRPPTGTVAIAGGADADASGGVVTVLPVARDALQQLQHGQARYRIYCAPCHGLVGDGQGIVVRRGFPQPPSYHSERLRAADDRYLASVIRDGHGVMFGYGDRIDPDDRDDIVRYIRALQRSQHAAIDRLPSSDREAVLTAGGER